MNKLINPEESRQLREICVTRLTAPIDQLKIQDLALVTKTLISKLSSYCIFYGPELEIHANHGGIKCVVRGSKHIFFVGESGHVKDVDFLKPGWMSFTIAIPETDGVSEVLKELVEHDVPLPSSLIDQIGKNALVNHGFFLLHRSLIDPPDDGALWLISKTLSRAEKHLASIACA